jgi:DNA-binding NarL/FixJ family response regulator
LSQQKISPEGCPALARPIAEHAIYPVLDEQGNVLSTVTIDLDMACLRRTLEEKQLRIQRLEEKLGDMAQDPGPDQEKQNDLLPAPLTNRELEVLRLLAQGDTNAAISLRLGISPHTVKSHVIHIFNKLGVNDRTQAAVWATRHQLV